MTSNAPQKNYYMLRGAFSPGDLGKIRAIINKVNGDINKFRTEFLATFSFAPLVFSEDDPQFANTKPANRILIN